MFRTATEHNCDVGKIFLDPLHYYNDKCNVSHRHCCGRSGTYIMALLPAEHWRGEKLLFIQLSRQLLQSWHQKGNNFLSWLEGLCLCPLHRRAREGGHLGPNKLLFECRLCLFLTCYPKLLVWDFSSLKSETNRHNFVGRVVILKEIECVLVPDCPVL